VASCSLADHAGPNDPHNPRSHRQHALVPTHCQCHCPTEMLPVILTLTLTLTSGLHPPSSDESESQLLTASAWNSKISTPPSLPLPSYTSVGCGEEADCRRAAFLLKLVLRRLALGADYGCIALAVTHHITGRHQVQFTVANVWRHPG
jgi:hypothetical protein